MTAPPVRLTLRDRLLDAEQARAEVTIATQIGTYRGVVRDVGVDCVSISTHQGTADLALFHIISLEW